jgi:hypothetical protein
VDDDYIDPAGMADIFRQACAVGDKQAIWRAIIYCAAHDIRPWEWLRERLLQIDNAAEAGALKSWNDVFGKPWGKGQRRGAENWALRFRVHQAVLDEKNRTDQPINNDLFDCVAKKFKFKRSKVAELYARVNDALERAVRDSRRD